MIPLDLLKCLTFINKFFFEKSVMSILGATYFSEDNFKNFLKKFFFISLNGMLASVIFLLKSIN